MKNFIRSVAIVGLAVSLFSQSVFAMRDSLKKEKENFSAKVIQAHTRGYFVRKEYQKIKPKASQTASDSLSSLPPDVLTSKFNPLRYLDLNDLQSSREVSHQWQDISHDAAAHRYLDLLPSHTHFLYLLEKLTLKNPLTIQKVVSASMISLREHGDSHSGMRVLNKFASRDLEVQRRLVQLLPTLRVSPEYSRIDLDRAEVILIGLGEMQLYPEIQSRIAEQLDSTNIQMQVAAATSFGLSKPLSHEIYLKMFRKANELLVSRANSYLKNKILDAIKSYGSIPTGARKEVFEKLTSSDSHIARLGAIYALASLPENDPLMNKYEKALRRLIDSKNYEDRLVAAQAAGELRSSSELIQEIIEKGVNDPNVGVNNVTFWAIQKKSNIQNPIVTQAVVDFISFKLTNPAVLRALIYLNPSHPDHQQKLADVLVLKNESGSYRYSADERLVVAESLSGITPMTPVLYRALQEASFDHGRGSDTILVGSNGEQEGLVEGRRVSDGANRTLKVIQERGDVPELDSTSGQAVFNYAQYCDVEYSD